ncbi:MAG: [citrate (pro-3S)-lyase] ligase, partial [Peptococcaceae bacterium]|nr:[citrate (pro-3S)-lyase] ligase [Peptococcaceae bacterium]
MWQNYSVETAYDRQEVKEFLEQFQLQYDPDSEVTVVVRQNGAVVATGSLRGNVLQCFAVDKEMQGEGFANKVVDHLTQIAFARGKSRIFVFTTPANIPLFKGLAFRLLAETQWAALLESGYPTINEYTKALGQLKPQSPGTISGLVLNCNPFTLGHQYLVGQASACSDHVFLQVVEEDRSVFPFATRIDLVKKGTAHLSNVTVLPSGPYAVSLATFPSYFSAEETSHARAGASIDATIYATYIAASLGIKQRLVGTEPYSPVTAIYNETLHQVLGEHGIILREISRKEQDGRAISASLVRKALREDDHAILKRLVPTSTLDFLLSDQARNIISKLKQSM